MITIDTIIDDILKREGGYVDHPADKGGPTRWGITQESLSDWRKRPVSVDEVKALTQNEARDIYRNVYIMRPGFNAIQDPQLLALVADCSVNHGPSRAQKWLSVANISNPRQAYAQICAARIRFYGQIITARPQQAVFAAGWMNRAAEFVEQSQ